MKVDSDVSRGNGKIALDLFYLPQATLYGLISLMA
jgi:hypothetical protein